MEHDLGGLTSADFRVAIGEQRQKWDHYKAPGSTAPSTASIWPVVTDSCAFAIGKFVNNKIFVAWIELKKKKQSLRFEVSKVLCSRHGLCSSPDTFLAPVSFSLEQE